MINCEVNTKQTMFVPSLNCSFKIVDYLTTTGILEFILIGSVPKEAPAFKSLWLPFDTVTWFLILCAAIACATALFVIERTLNQLLSQNTLTFFTLASEGG